LITILHLEFKLRKIATALPLSGVGQFTMRDGSNFDQINGQKKT